MPESKSSSPSPRADVSAAGARASSARPDAAPAPIGSAAVHGAAPDPFGSPDVRYSYRSGLVERMRTTDFTLRRGRVTIRAAQKFGFCWGVDRAVAMIHDLLRERPGRRVWLLNQIIHNPRVNADLEARGVRFLLGPRRKPDAVRSEASHSVSIARPTEPGRADDGGDPFAAVGPNDVVVIPAFHAEVESLERLRAIGCEVLDTTCPWVSKPHRRTLRNIDDGFTTVIHGYFEHDETRATRSLIGSRGADYVVVQDLEETEALAEVVRTGRVGPRFEALRPRRTSRGFDPARHLERIGLINQTTMLASESRRVGEILGAAMRERHGEAAAATLFRDFDTICPATQNNQDAVEDLLRSAEPDLLIVVGGYDSSNTRNLVRTVGSRSRAYHIEDAAAIGPRTLRHRDTDEGVVRVAEDWLPSGPVTIGLTAGASTPDSELERVIRRILEAAGEDSSL